MNYNWGRRRNRLRKGKRGITSSYGYSPRAAYRPIYNKNRRTTPEWGGLHRAWLGFVIAKSQDDYEKMRKYAIVIRKFQRRLNIAISDFLDIGVYGFEEDFENKVEDDDSKLAVYDSRTGEKIRDANEDGDEDEEDNNDSHFYQNYTMPPSMLTTTNWYLLLPTYIVIGVNPTTRLHIDGSNPVFIRTLRQTLGVNTEPYPGNKNCSRIEELRQLGQVIPIHFGLMGITMMSHLQHIGSEGVLAIDAEKHPQLINQLAIAEHRTLDWRNHPL